MKTVFIGGSRDVTRFNPIIEERLHAILDAELPVLVGDANGADKAVQRWFAAKSYPDVSVFHSDDSPRNNLGHWPTRRIIPQDQEKGLPLPRRQGPRHGGSCGLWLHALGWHQQGHSQQHPQPAGTGEKGRRLFHHASPAQRAGFPAARGFEG